MYYYAYIDSNSIVEGVYSLPSQITADGYIEITQDQYENGNLVGKYYNAETGEFEDAPAWVCSTDQVQYKETTTPLSTKLDEIEQSISESVDAYTKSESDSRYATADHTHSGYASSTHIHTAADVSGVVKTINGTEPDASGNVTVSVSGGGMTAAEILAAVKTVDGENSGLDADTLDGVEASGFATANHTHTEYATTTALESKADANHTHSDYAAVDHTHSGYASTSDITTLQTAIDGKANTNHTHSGYASTNDVESLETAVAGKADANHTHTGYAAVDHTHTGYASADHTHSGYATTSALSSLESTVAGKADANHTHSGYASSSHTHSQSDITGLASSLSGKSDTNHTHSEYASSSHTHTPSSIGAASASHTHSEYASSSHTHTSFSSAIDISGAIKSNGVQVGYNSGSDTTLGSNNYPTIVAGSYVTLNGEKTYAPNIYPRNTGTFYLGAQSNRWSGIYSKVAVNVSSDERLKENINDVDTSSCADFINSIEVKSFNYIDDRDKNEQIGVIAQQLISANPDLAKYFVEQGKDGYYGVKTSDLVFPLIVAVQELSKQIEELKG